MTPAHSDAHSVAPHRSTDFTTIWGVAGPQLANLQAVLAEKAHHYNTSFSIGVYDTHVGSFEVTAGVNDKLTGELMTVGKEFPVGSVTKSVLSCPLAHTRMHARTHAHAKHNACTLTVRFHTHMHTQGRIRCRH
jgi:hypothetical protein